MSHLLRIRLPDVPGTLGAVATAIGAVGANIEAIEIVEHGADGTAVDDVFVDLTPGLLPDVVISAVQRIDGVQVLWVTRYAAGGNLSLDLEAVEAITEKPARAIRRLTELVPRAFRADWALVADAADGAVSRVEWTPGAPDLPARGARVVPTRPSCSARTWRRVGRVVRDRGCRNPARVTDPRDRVRPLRRPGDPRLRARPPQPPRSLDRVDRRDRHDPIAVATMRIERWDGEQALDRSAEIWPVYERVFGDRANERDWRDAAFERHCGRRRFRLDAAFADASGDVSDGRLVGFAYGYVGDRGQYWPDRVAAALGDDIATAWVGGHFEFVELAVVEDMRRRGVGRALHDALMTDPLVDRALLSTDDDPQSPAALLYRSRGWERLTLLEPGVQVMGLRL